MHIGVTGSVMYPMVRDLSRCGGFGLMIGLRCELSMVLVGAVPGRAVMVQAVVVPVEEVWFEEVEVRAVAAM